MFSEKVKERGWPLVIGLTSKFGPSKLWQFDFSKPWWQIYTRHPFITSTILITSVLENGYLALLPVILARSLEYTRFDWLTLTLIGGLIIIFLRTFGYIINAKQVLGSMKSLAASSHNFFLTVDPLCHSTRSSGQILAKIDRAESSFLELDAILTFDLIPIMVGILTVVLTLLSFDLQLGLYAILIIFLILMYNIFCRLFVHDIFKDRLIQSNDISKSLSVETLQQVSFVRSVFATPEQSQKIQKVYGNEAVLHTHLWIISILIDMSVVFFYILASVLLSWKVLELIQMQTMSLALGTGLVASFVAGTSRINIVGSRVRRSLEHIHRIKDLFIFIRGFGKQSFPVLGEEHHPNPLQRGLN